MGRSQEHRSELFGRPLKRTPISCLSLLAHIHRFFIILQTGIVLHLVYSTSLWVYFSLDVIAFKMVYSTQIQSKFAHPVGEPVPAFNTEYVGHQPQSMD